MLVLLATLLTPGGGPAASASPRLGLLALTGDLRPTLIPRVYALDLRNRGRTDLAASEGGWDLALSPDRRWLVFVSGRDGFQALYVAHADGSDPRRLTGVISGTPWFGGDCAASESNPVWSPDGQQIVFELVFSGFCTPPRASARRLSAARYTVALPHRLALVNADGSGLRVLDVDGFSPRWSPDGTRLAYVERSTNTFAVAPGETSGIVRLDDGAARTLGPGTAPAWAPDSASLALPTGHGTVRVFDADGRLLRSVRGDGAGWTRCGLVVSRSGSVAISPDRRTAALRGAGGVAEQTCGGRSRVSARGRWQPLSFAPDGRRLLLGGCSRGRCTLAVAGGGASFAVIGRQTVVEPPAWSPDSRRLAFLGPDGAVVVANASTGHAAAVAAEGGDSVVTPPIWSDDATILYGSHTSGVESNLYTLDPTSGRARLVARVAADPVWSPDGKTLAFQTPAGIWLTGSAAGARLRLWLKTPTAGGLAWSPDGRQLAFSDGERVLLADRAGSVRPVIGPIEGITLSAWSPDGRWLAYSVPSWGAIPGIWIVHPDGSDNHLLVPQATNFVWSPDGWSPDGSWLAYSVPSWGAIPGIWIVHPDGSDNHLFVPQATNLVWSPDGTHIAYIENSRLWVADADGDAAAPLPGDFEAALSWPTANGILALHLSEAAANNAFGLPLFEQLLLVAPDGSSETELTSSSTIVFAAAWQPVP